MKIVSQENAPSQGTILLLYRVKALTATAKTRCAMRAGLLPECLAHNQVIDNDFHCATFYGAGIMAPLKR